MLAEADGRRQVRIGCGVAALAAGLALIGSSFLGWITTAMVGGGRTSISGWGMISGGNPVIDGVNLNTLMAGEGSYRPGVPVLAIGAITVVPALILAVTGAGHRPNRVVGGLLAACGAAGVGWGLAKIIAPGDAVGVLPDGQGAPGAGPMLATAAGVVLLVVAGLLLAGRLDPPVTMPRRGVQGRRR